MKYIEKYKVFEDSKETEYNEISDLLEQKLSKQYTNVTTDDIYECHSWVMEARNFLKRTYKNVKIYYGAADEIDPTLYYKESDNVDKKLNPILKKYGLSSYLEYVNGHSFVKIGDIFIDLTLRSEGVKYKDVQKVDKILTDSIIKFDMR